MELTGFDIYGLSLGFSGLMMVICMQADIAANNAHKRVAEKICFCVIAYRLFCIVRLYSPRAILLDFFSLGRQCDGDQPCRSITHVAAKNDQGFIKYRTRRRVAFR